MGRSALLGACLVLGLAPAAAGTEAADRLDRFREAGVRYAETRSGEEGGAEGAAELFALVDDEVGESLRGGEPFASAGFIREQLHGFSAAWGGAAFEVILLGRAPAGLTLVVATLAGGERTGSLRMYGSSAQGEPGLLAAATHAGTPAVHPWPPGSHGGVRFVALWVGEPAGGAARPLRLELWERRGRGAPVRRWGSPEAFGSGLRATAWAVHPGEIRVRHQPRYPGWVPGCAAATEVEDAYREVPGGGLALAERRVLDGWHRELGAAVKRLLDALAAGNAAGVAELVPDPALRRRLPPGLEAEPACEERRPEAPSTVVVAATHEAEGRRVPWSLRWQRTTAGWRLTAAGPVLQ